jgi:hypothetical protein
MLTVAGVMGTTGRGTREIFFESLSRQRFAKKISLKAAASIPIEKFPLSCGLHAFRNHALTRAV